jgi:hypothetical protein
MSGRGLKDMVNLSRDAIDPAAELESEKEVPGREGACQLLRCDDQELPALPYRRDAYEPVSPASWTYSRKVFIPFHESLLRLLWLLYLPARSWQPGAHTTTPDEVMEALSALENDWVVLRRFQPWRQTELLFRNGICCTGSYKSTLQYLGSDVREGAARVEPAAASESWTDECRVVAAASARVAQYGSDA